MKHSKLGIASFALACTAAMSAFALLAITIVLSQIRNPDHDAKEVGAALLILCLFALMGMNLLAVGLGIGGMVQPERKRVFAVLGTGFSGVQVLLGILIMSRWIAPY